jgi:peptidoglycan hydrolase CwlO-like protein
MGILLTIATLIANVTYRSGHLSARVEELEKWRENLRDDMHEISDKLTELSGEFKRLTAVIEERTDRRTEKRT